MNDDSMDVTAGTAGDPEQTGEPGYAPLSRAEFYTPAIDLNATTVDIKRVGVVARPAEAAVLLLRDGAKPDDVLAGAMALAYRMGWARGAMAGWNAGDAGVYADRQAMQEAISSMRADVLDGTVDEDAYDKQTTPSITTMAAGWKPRGVALVEASSEPGRASWDW